MAEAMVTARMSQEKKARGAQILKSNDMNASQAVNMMYDKIIEDRDLSFLNLEPKSTPAESFKNASDFVDSLSLSYDVDFPDMTRAELRVQRLSKRGLM